MKQMTEKYKQPQPNKNPLPKGAATKGVMARGPMG